MAESKARTGEKQVPGLARNDNFFQKLSKNSNSNSNSNRNSNGKGKAKATAKQGQQQQQQQGRSHRTARAGANTGISPLRITETTA